MEGHGDEEVSLTQAAAFFKVHPDTLINTLVPQYNIPYRKDKRRRFFRMSDLIRTRERMYQGKEGT